MPSHHGAKSSSLASADIKDGRHPTSKQKGSHNPFTLPPTSRFPNMRNPNKPFSIGICLLLSFFFVLATRGLFPSPAQLHSLLSRSFGLRSLDSELSVTTRLAVDSLLGMVVSKSMTRSSQGQVQFDNYSLILRGQRIFL